MTAFSDVENALIAVRQNTEREKLQNAAAAASRRAYDASIQRLKEGTIDIVTLSTTQTTLFSNLDLAAQTRIARFQALVSPVSGARRRMDRPNREIAKIEEENAFSDPKGIIP